MNTIRVADGVRLRSFRPIAPESGDQRHPTFGDGCLEFLWCLVFAIWDFVGPPLQSSRRCLCFASFILAIPAGQAAGASFTNAPAVLKTNLPLQQIASGVFQLGQVRVDSARKTVAFPAFVNMTAGLMEYFLVTSSGKTHESVLRTDVPPFQIQVAMLLLGARGTTNSFPDDPAKPLPGDQVSLEIRWKMGRKEKHARAEEWVFNAKARTAMSKGPWIYNGSTVIDGSFIAQEQGSIISVMEDPYAQINNPRPGREDDTIWMVRKSKVPPLETPVEVIIQLLNAGAKSH